MGSFTKINHGVEYVYWLIGKKQFYIGPKNEPDKVRKENVYKALDFLAKNFDRSLADYHKEISNILNYLSEAERKEYLEKRTAELQTRLRQVEPQRILTPTVPLLINRIRRKTQQHKGFSLEEKKNFQEFLKEIEEELRDDAT